MTAVYGVTTSSDGPLDWSHAEECLKRARNYWIATTRPYGTPHAVPVWNVWVEGSLYFGTSRSSVKGRNLAHSPRLVVHLESADDVVIIEGEVEEVRDWASFDAIDVAYRTKYGMGVAEAEEEGAVWYVVRPKKAHAWLETNFPNTATRWRYATARGDRVTHGRLSAAVYSS
jgi:nitroimidazol reductase NimA-like FMN-containing flavoprotein (pyridoxamine 5'-phosphate oxidase superfamily)